MDIKRLVYGSIALLYYGLPLILVSVPEFSLSLDGDMTSVYLSLGRGGWKIRRGHEALFGFHPGQRHKKLSVGLG